MTDSMYLVFSLNTQVFGIELLQIKEVFSYRKITPLPEVGGFVQGVINLRGLIMPVFELRHKFRLPVGEYSSFHVIIAVESARRVMGIIADEITDVLEIAPEELQDAESFPPGLPREFLKGVGRKEEQLILLLDVDRLLGSEELTGVDTAHIVADNAGDYPQEACKKPGGTVNSSEEPKHGQDIGSR
jgi:purine-binding chemotaxis protein CheW